MNIKQITLAGEYEIDIVRAEYGAAITTGDRVLFRVKRSDSREMQFEKACDVAKRIFGRDAKRGGPGRTRESSDWN